MRFSARLVPLKGRALVGPFDASRRFILSLFLLDKTLAVWEPRTDNSGMPGGTFLERTRVKNPTTGLPYNDTDLQVGTVHRFVCVWGCVWVCVCACTHTHTLLYVSGNVGEGLAVRGGCCW